MNLAGKLQLKAGQSVAVINGPADVTLDVPSATHPAGDPASADAVLVFVRTTADLDDHAAPAVDAANADRLTWIAYPKAKKLGTDLNRDTLNAALNERGAQAVRQVSIDDTWSALRFRPQ